MLNCHTDLSKVERLVGLSPNNWFGGLVAFSLLLNLCTNLQEHAIFAGSIFLELFKIIFIFLHEKRCNFALKSENRLRP